MSSQLKPGLFLLLLLATASYIASSAGCDKTVSVAELLSKPPANKEGVCVRGVLDIKGKSVSRLVFGESEIHLALIRRSDSKSEIATDEARKAEWRRLYQGECILVQGVFNPGDPGQIQSSPPYIENIALIFPSKEPCPEVPKQEGFWSGK